jgi:GMP synthase (glutamine-hydrolysing)
MALYVLVTGDPTPLVRDMRGDFTRLFSEALGEVWPEELRAIDVRVEPFTLPDDAEGIIVTGSSSHLAENAPWMERTKELLREAVAARIPTLGVCFGHQLLGEALGGTVVRNPRGREIGSLSIERLAAADDDPLFAALPHAFDANVTHLDTVSRLPAGATVLARSAVEDHHAVRFGDVCWGVQFHPEIDREVMRGYLESRRPVLTDEGRDVDALLADARETPLARAILRRFVELFVLTR